MSQLCVSLTCVFSVVNQALVCPQGSCSGVLTEGLPAPSVSECFYSVGECELSLQAFRDHTCSKGILTSDRRRPDQPSTSDVSFGRWEAELSWYGCVGLGGVKHRRTEVRRRGVVHL